jgi:hypothetical protein
LSKKRAEAPRTCRQESFYHVAPQTRCFNSLQNT